MPVDVSVTLRQALMRLETERARIDKQITGLKQALGAVRASTDGGPATGRPRAKRSRKHMSAAQRKAVGERMRAYWAKRRKKQKTGKKK